VEPLANSNKNLMITFFSVWEISPSKASPTSRLSFSLPCRERSNKIARRGKERKALLVELLAAVK
jgi:hypothetical protein